MQSFRRIASLLVALASLPASVVVAQRTSPPAPVTEAEGAAFVATLLERSRAMDCAGIETMFDVHAIVSRGIEGMPLRASERMSLETSIARQLVAPNIGVITTLCAGPSAERIVARGHGTVGGVPVERLRVEIVGGGVRYVDLVLGRARDRTPVIVDVLLPAQDSSLSVQVRDSATPIGGADTPFVRSLDARGRLRMHHFATYRVVQEAAAAADVDRVEATVAQLPPELASDPMILQLRVTCAQRAGDSTAYRAALDDYLRLHPDSVAANLFAIDALTLRRDYDGALRAVDRIESVVGSDAYLMMFRGLMHGLAGRHAESLPHLRAAVASDPDLGIAWGLLLDVAITLGRDDDTLHAFAALERLQALPPRVHVDAVYARLRARPEYRAAHPATAAPVAPTPQTTQGGSSRQGRR